MNPLTLSILPCKGCCVGLWIVCFPGDSVFPIELSLVRFPFGGDPVYFSPTHSVLACFFCLWGVLGVWFYLMITHFWSGGDFLDVDGIGCGSGTAFTWVKSWLGQLLRSIDQDTKSLPWNTIERLTIWVPQSHSWRVEKDGKQHIRSKMGSIHK